MRLAKSAALQILSLERPCGMARPEISLEKTSPTDPARPLASPSTCTLVRVPCAASFETCQERTSPDPVTRRAWQHGTARDPVGENFSNGSCRHFHISQRNKRMLHQSKCPPMHPLQLDTRLALNGLLRRRPGGSNTADCLLESYSPTDPARPLASRSTQT